MASAGSSPSGRAEPGDPPEDPTPHVSANGTDVDAVPKPLMSRAPDWRKQRAAPKAAAALQLPEEPLLPLTVAEVAEARGESGEITGFQTGSGQTGFSQKGHESQTFGRSLL